MKDITTEEAIKRLHDLIHTCDVGIEKHGAYDDLFALDKQALEKVLNELEKKDKIIDAMAKRIQEDLKREYNIDRTIEQLKEFYREEVENHEKNI